MEPSASIIVIVAVIALTLQGGSCLFSDKRSLAIGFIDLILAAIALFDLISLRSGHMVLAAEFGSIMVLGDVSRWLLGISLVIFSITPGLCWSRILKLNHWGWFYFPICVAGLVVGVGAAISIRSINPGDPKPLQVYCYDAWWPPMLLWLATCFCGSVLGLIEEGYWVEFLAFLSASLAPLSALAFLIEDSDYPRSHLLWAALQRLSFGAAVLLIAFWFVEKPPTGQLKLRVKILLPFAILGPIAAWAPIATDVRLLLGIVPLVPFTILLGYSVAREWMGEQKSSSSQIASRAYHLWEERGRPTGSPELDWVKAAGDMSLIVGVKRIARLLYSLALPIIALSLIDLFGRGYLNRSIEMAILFAFWVVLAERLAKGGLEQIPEWLKNLWRTGALPLSLLQDLGRYAFNSYRKLRTGAVATVQGKPTWAGAVKLVAGTVAFILLMTVFDEVTSSRKTVIRISWNGPTDTKGKDDISQAMSDGLVNALGRLRQGLRPDLLIAVGKSPGEHGAGPLNAARADSSALENAVAKSDDLRIAGLQIPLRLLYSPIQQWIRSALGVRVISGSVQKTSDNRFVAYIDSSDGQSWQESNDLTSPPASDTTVPSCTDEMAGSKDPVSVLVEKLAFDVASSEPSFLAAGMSGNWGAFRSFGSGLCHWNLYQGGGNPQELRYAILGFRNAISQDRDFAAAQYHLGLALLRHGEPRTAVEAFQGALTSNSQFRWAATAEALALYNRDWYYPTKAAVLSPIPSTGAARNEARRIWGSVIEAPRREVAVSEERDAFRGLCLYELDDRINRARDQEHDMGDDFRLPFFYCSVANALSSQIPAVDRRAGEETQLRASILNLLGLSLDWHHRQRRVLEPLRPQAWMCFADGTGSKVYVSGSRTTSRALSYYRMSLQLTPADAVVMCNEASAEAYLSEAGLKAMDRLSQNSMARQALADSLVENANNLIPSSPRSGAAAKNYSRALEQYEEAIRLDPTSIYALNGYAYTCWQWQLEWLRRRAAEPPTGDIEFRAEHYAREARRVAHTRQPSDGHWSEDELTASDTLGEILLAQGRTAEAAEVLTNVIKNSDIDWQGLDETRWDLAQTEICRARATADIVERGKLFSDAMNIFSDIEHAEDTHEFRPFSASPEFLDPISLGRFCAPRPDKPPPQLPKFIIMQAQYGPGPGCVWCAVTAAVHDGNTLLGGYMLHVWGGGVDERIRIVPDQDRSIQLERPPRKRQDYFYAQLEDDNGQPVSAVTSVETYEEAKKDSCSRNWIKLVFEMRRDIHTGRGGDGPQPLSRVPDG